MSGLEKPYIGSIGLRSSPEEDSYLNGLGVIKYLQSHPWLELPTSVTFFVGENGTGKSTLLEGIAAAAGFNPEGGSRNFDFSTQATHSELYRHLRLARYGRPKDGYFLRAESFYNVASYIDRLDAEPGLGDRLIDGYGGVSLHSQSHGESFLALVLNRFRGSGLYLLDEPEAALSPMRLMTLLCAIHRLVQQNSQFIISTHSPILMAYPGATVFQLSETGLKQVDCRQTEHWQITQRFLKDPERMLRYLLEEE